MNDELTLRDVAQRACSKHRVAGGRALDRVAKKLGLKISYTTVDRILSGTYLSTPKRELLDGLAELSGLSKEVVYRAANVPLPVSAFVDQLPPDADLLTPEQRKAVFSIVRSLAAANRSVARLEGLIQIGMEYEEDARHETSSTTSSSDGGVRRGRRTPMKPPLSVVPETVESTGSEGDLGLVASDGNRDHEEEVRRLIDEGLREQGRNPDQK